MNEQKRFRQLFATRAARMIRTFIPPCEPTLRDHPPKSEGWFYEVKFDGYRMHVPTKRKRIPRFWCTLTK